MSKGALSLKLGSKSVAAAESKLAEARQVRVSSPSPPVPSGQKAVLFFFS